jgi:hypothetical protein
MVQEAQAAGSTETEMALVILTLLFLFFLPFVVSLFGRPLFAFAAFFFCCLTAWTVMTLSGERSPAVHILMLFGSWFAGLIAAVIGVSTKREHLLKRAIRGFYCAFSNERRRLAMHGKNRAVP